MNRTTLEGYEQLGRALVWAAGVVLVLGIVGAIIIAGSDDALPLFEDVERQGRGVAALASAAAVLHELGRSSRAETPQTGDPPVARSTCGAA